MTTMTTTMNNAAEVQDAQKRGYQIANNILRDDLRRKLSKDPSLDLLHWLKQQLAEYPTSRAKSAAWAVRKVRDELTTPCQSMAPATVHILGLSSKSEMRVESLRPLHHAVSEWFADRNLSEFPRNGLVNTFHQLLGRCEVIADLTSSAIIGLNPQVVVKITHGPSIQYLHTYEYLLDLDVGLPIPRLLGVLRTDHLTYTFMDRVRGVSLDKIWTRISDCQKVAIQKQLDVIFRTLRSVPRPSSDDGVLAMGTGKPARCIDLRRNARVATDSITTEHDFNRFLVHTSRTSPQLMLEMAASFLQEDHEIVMTHSDLHPRNIMVEEAPNTDVNGNALIDVESAISITGIIDWELSGWYPSYWEYVKALNTITANQGTLDWYRYLPTKAIGTFAKEYAVDQLIDRRL